MSEPFASLYRKNVDLPHESWGAVAQVLAEEFPGDHAAVDGTVAEVGRCFYFPDGDPSGRGASARDLAAAARMPLTAFVIEALEEWLVGARDAAATAGIPLLDLFYWELRLGRWAASALTELDLVQQTFTPFNHRVLITTLLSLDSRHRTRPAHAVYLDVIRRLWPEVLREPINPRPLRQRWKRIPSRLMRALGGPRRQAP